MRASGACRVSSGVDAVQCRCPTSTGSARPSARSDPAVTQLAAPAISSASSGITAASGTYYYQFRSDNQGVPVSLQQDLIFNFRGPYTLSFAYRALADPTGEQLVRTEGQVGVGAWEWLACRFGLKSSPAASGYLPGRHPADVGGRTGQYKHLGGRMDPHLHPSRWVPHLRPLMPSTAAPRGSAPRCARPCFRPQTLHRRSAR